MTSDVQEDCDTLAGIRRAVEAAENAGDAEYIAGLFGDHAVLMVPDFPIQEGRSACAGFIRELLPGLHAHFHRRVVYTSHEVRVLGNLAFDLGSFYFTVQPRAGGPSSRVTGKYLWVYERDPGRAWTYSRVIMSRDEDAEPREADSRQHASGLSSGLALLFALVLAAGEVVRNWGDWGFWPFWLVDYLAVGLLLLGWRASRNGWASAPALLAGAWGFTCAMFYMSFFLEFVPSVTPDRGLIGRSMLTWVKGLLFAVSAFGFAASLLNLRPSTAGQLQRRGESRPDAGREHA